MYKQGLLERVINFTEASGKVVSLSEGTQVEFLSEGAGTYVKLGEQVNKFDVPAFKFLKENALATKNGYYGHVAASKDKDSGKTMKGIHTGVMRIKKDIDLHTTNGRHAEKIPAGSDVAFQHDTTENTTTLHSKSRHPDHFGEHLLHTFSGHPHNHGTFSAVRIHESLNESSSDNHGYSPNTEVEHHIDVKPTSKGETHYGDGVLHKDLGASTFNVGKKVEFTHDKNTNTTKFYRKDLGSDTPHTVSGHPSQHANIHSVTVVHRTPK